MDTGRLSIRLMGFLLSAAIPPLVALVVVDVAAPDSISRLGEGTVLAIATGLTLLWSGMLAAIGGRWLGRELRHLVDVAEQGRDPAGEPIAEAGRRIAATLEERNRQIGELVKHTREAPITENPAAVVRAMVAAARSVTQDPTWSLAVLRSPDERILSRGVYGTTSARTKALTDVHAWAATAEDAGVGAVSGARHVEGPWGAFVIVEVTLHHELVAVLLAPRSGRPAPSHAELQVLDLLGQHAAPVIEHALLVEQLRRQAAELNRMAAVQTDFLRGVTHDLQTPLTSIRALAEELKDLPAGSPSAATDLEAIAHQADRLRRLVGQLLVASRLEANALAARHELFRPEPVVRRTWQALRVERPFELMVTGPGALMVGDADRFEQVLWALLDNAVKYSPPQTPVHVELKTVESGDGAALELVVTDRGMGMTAAERRRAFDQFYRSSPARSAVPDGSGIGLYAARGLVQTMGGSIRAEAGPGGPGTTIRVRLPAELTGTSDQD